MIQVQDDTQIPSKADLSTAAVASSANDQSKIDDLLKQLEDLSQEIEKKSAAPVVAAPKEPVKIESPVSTPVLEPAPEPVKIAEPEAKPALSPTADPVKDSNDKELDDLIAELEESLKNLVARKEASNTKTDSGSTSVNEAVVKPVVAPVLNETEKKDSEDDFDLDAFIKDLEKKIADEDKQDAPKEDSALATEDFRKNRLAPDIEEPDAEVQETVASNPSPEPAKSSDPESLEAQNIFAMLNINDASDQEKDQFLSDLENLIWDNFVETDLPLLLTSQEYGEAKQILDQQTKSELDKKEALLAYLEKLIPDLEEIMYEKALDLKKDLMVERVRKLKIQDASKNEALTEVEKLMAENKWQAATTALNKI